MIIAGEKSGHSRCSHGVLEDKKLALSSKRRGLGEGLASSSASLDVVGRNLLSFYFRWIHKEKVAAA